MLRIKTEVKISLKLSVELVLEFIKGSKGIREEGFAMIKLSPSEEDRIEIDSWSYDDSELMNGVEEKIADSLSDLSEEDLKRISIKGVEV